MPKFLYKVKNRQNEIISSSIFSESISNAASELEKQGFVILEIKEEETDDVKFSKEKFKTIDDNTFLSLDEKKSFFNSFYYLYKSGYSYIDLFRSISSNTKNEKIKTIASDIASSIKNGANISESLSKYKNVVGYAYTMLVLAGDKSGKLEEILYRINEDLKREEFVKRTIISSMTYPVIVLSFALAVFLFCKFFLFRIFASFSSGPMCVTSLFFLFITSIIKILIIFALIIGGVIYLSKNKKNIDSLIQYFSEIHPFSYFIKNYTFLNFFSILELSYQSGIPVCDSIAIASTIVRIKDMKNKINKIFMRIMNGCEVTSAFAASEIFDEYVISQIATGEKTGEFDKAFANISNDCAVKLEDSIKTIGKIIEPLMIFVAGIVVCVIAVQFYRNLYAGIFSMF